MTATCDRGDVAPPGRPAFRLEVPMKKKLTPVVGLLALPLLLAPTLVRAEVKPGDKITSANVAQIKDMVSPGIEWLRQARHADDDRRVQADRDAEGLSRGDREVLGPGEALGRRPPARRLRRRPAVPQDRRQRSAGGAEDHVELRPQAADHRRPRLRNFDADTGTIEQRRREMASSATTCSIICGA